MRQENDRKRMSSQDFGRLAWRAMSARLNSEVDQRIPLVSQLLSELEGVIPTTGEQAKYLKDTLVPLARFYINEIYPTSPDSLFRVSSTAGDVLLIRGTNRTDEGEANYSILCPITSDLQVPDQVAHIEVTALNSTEVATFKLISTPAMEAVDNPLTVSPAMQEEFQYEIERTRRDFGIGDDTEVSKEGLARLVAEINDIDRDIIRLQSRRFSGSSLTFRELQEDLAELTATKYIYTLTILDQMWRQMQSNPHQQLNLITTLVRSEGHHRGDPHNGPTVMIFAGNTSFSPEQSPNFGYQIIALNLSFLDTRRLRIIDQMVQACGNYRYLDTKELVGSKIQQVVKDYKTGQTVHTSTRALKRGDIKYSSTIADVLASLDIPPEVEEPIPPAEFDIRRPEITNERARELTKEFFRDSVANHKVIIPIITALGGAYKTVRVSFLNNLAVGPRGTKIETKIKLLSNEPSKDTDPTVGITQPVGTSPGELIISGQRLTITATDPITINGVDEQTVDQLIEFLAKVGHISPARVQRLFNKIQEARLFPAEIAARQSKQVESPELLTFPVRLSTIIYPHKNSAQNPQNITECTPIANSRDVLTPEQIVGIVSNLRAEIRGRKTSEVLTVVKQKVRDIVQANARSLGRRGKETVVSIPYDIVDLVMSSPEITGDQDILMPEFTFNEPPFFSQRVLYDWVRRYDRDSLISYGVESLVLQDVSDTPEISAQRSALRWIFTHEVEQLQDFYAHDSISVETNEGKMTLTREFFDEQLSKLILSDNNMLRILVEDVITEQLSLESTHARRTMMAQRQSTTAQTLLAFKKAHPTVPCYTRDEVIMIMDQLSDADVFAIITASHVNPNTPQNMKALNAIVTGFSKIAVEKGIRITQI